MKIMIPVLPIGAKSFENNDIRGNDWCNIFTKIMIPVGKFCVNDNTH